MILDAVTLVCFALAGIAALMFVLLWTGPEWLARWIRTMVIPLLLAIAFVDWIWT